MSYYTDLQRLFPLAYKNKINITMYLFPEIYSEFVQRESLDSQIIATGYYSNKDRKYHTDVDPGTIINGPFSEYGEELSPSVREAYNEYIKDCIWLINEVGFTIIDQHTSTNSKKSEYILLFGLNGNPCGTLVYDLRISDHPFDATFPEEWKQRALEYLKMNNVLDGTATEAGIDFQVAQVIVGSSKTDSWDKAYNRLYLLLKKMKRQVQIRLRRDAQ